MVIGKVDIRVLVDLKFFILLINIIILREKYNNITIVVELELGLAPELVPELDTAEVPVLQL
jgi:hypothetical protein